MPIAFGSRRFVREWNATQEKHKKQDAMFEALHARAKKEAEQAASDETSQNHPTGLVEAINNLTAAVKENSAAKKGPKLG